MIKIFRPSLLQAACGINKYWCGQNILIFVVIKGKHNCKFQLTVVFLIYVEKKYLRSVQGRDIKCKNGYTNDSF